ncbi:MAG: DUF2062 domain-containing protein [Gammaproteobacteria bacterium]|nr:DUF2062 domain-containing protein [Gammaproteobacteria bacterium]
MARRLIRRYLPDIDRVRNHKHLQFFGRLLHDPNLWHLNRHSVASAFAIGLFWAFIPMPLQSVPAAAFAILFRANLAIAVALVWITNPLTLAPVFYFCYTLGAYLLNTPHQDIAISPTWEWLSGEFLRVWQPFVLGSVVVSSSLAVLGYYGIHWLWRWQVGRDWDRRRSQRSNSRLD